VVFAGVDYARILARCGGGSRPDHLGGRQQRLPLRAADLHIVLVDPLRAGHDAISHHPGEAVLRMADVVVVAKTTPATPRPRAQRARRRRGTGARRGRSWRRSPVTLDDPAPSPAAACWWSRTARRSPTAAWPTARASRRRRAGRGRSSIRAPARCGDRRGLPAYPHIGKVLPAMGYSPAQRTALAATINASSADVVVSATPCDLGRLVAIDKPLVRAGYEFAEVVPGALSSIVDAFLARRGFAGDAEA
jgi:predicted GTPase